MPEQDIIFKKITNDYTLQLSKFDDNSEVLFSEIKNDLSNDEIIFFNKIKNNKRKIEWLGTRILLKNILGIYTSIQYDDKGTPFINNGKNISITHTGNYVGIILSRNKNVGIDTEFISERILRTAHKFIPENILTNLIKEKNTEKIYLHWCCKETLFKIKGGGGYDFKEDFIINPFNIEKHGEIISEVIKNQAEQYKLLYKFIKHENKEILIVWHG